MIKHRYTIIIVFLVAGLTSCGPRITSTLIDPQPKLQVEEKVALLDIHHELPENTVKIGDLRFQDSGLSTDCSFNSIMNKARKIARDNGANIVKVVDKKTPDLWSTCYRLKIELHRYDKDISDLPQYQLTLD